MFSYCIINYVEIDNFTQKKMAAHLSIRPNGTGAFTISLNSLDIIKNKIIFFTRNYNSLIFSGTTAICNFINEEYFTKGKGMNILDLFFYPRIIKGT